MTSRAFDLTVVDGSGDIFSALSIDSATKGDTGAQDLLGGTLELDRIGLLCFSHFLCYLEDIVKLNVTVVLHVLGLLSVSSWFFQGLNDQGSSRRKDLDCALSVLDSYLDLDFHTLPFLGGFLDIFTDLLGRKTNWTAFWCKGGSASDLTTNHFHVN